MKLSKKGEYALRSLINLGIAAEMDRKLVQVSELAESEQLPVKFLEQILQALKEAGIVEARAEAQRRVYRIRPEPLAEVDEWLAPYRALWTASLDRLEQHLEQRRNQ